MMRELQAGRLLEIGVAVALTAAALVFSLARAGDALPCGPAATQCEVRLSPR